MKNLCLICLGLVMSYSILAQNYHPFDTASVWIIENVYTSVIPPYYTNTYGLFISGDTIINTQTYKKIKRRGAWSSSTGVINMGGQLGTTYTNNLNTASTVIGAIREDSLKRVYYYNMNANIYSSVLPPGQEVLLYDFGKVVGDSILQYFESGIYDSTYMHITAIDSIQLYDSTFRKRFHLSGIAPNIPGPYNNIFYFWVEGIGVLGFPHTLNMAGYHAHSEGLLGGRFLEYQPTLASASRIRQIRCFSTHDVRLFSSYNHNSFCDTLPPHLLDINVVQSEKQAFINLYPNPFQQQATLDIEGLDFNQKIDLQIFDGTGQLVREQNTVGHSFIIDKKDLPTGLYFYQLWADKRSIGQGKFIITP